MAGDAPAIAASDVFMVTPLGMVAAALVFQCEMFYFGAVRDGRPKHLAGLRQLEATPGCAKQ
jgi:hypothetical protein